MSLRLNWKAWTFKKKTKKNPPYLHNDWYTIDWIIAMPWPQSLSLFSGRANTWLIPADTETAMKWQLESDAKQMHFALCRQFHLNQEHKYQLIQWLWNCLTGGDSPSGTHAAFGRVAGVHGAGDLLPSGRVHTPAVALEALLRPVEAAGVAARAETWTQERLQAPGLHLALSGRADCKATRQVQEFHSTCIYTYCSLYTCCTVYTIYTVHTYPYIHLLVWLLAFF